MGSMGTRLAPWGLSPQTLGPWLVEEGQAARSNHLFENKVISLQVPTLLLGMTMPPNHFEIPSSPLPPLLPSLAHPPPPGSSPGPRRGQITIVFIPPLPGSTCGFSTQDTSQDLVLDLAIC